MKPLTPKVHAIIDYAFAVVLLATALAVSSSGGVRPAFWIALLSGLAVFLYSLFTDYEFGVWRWIPMRLHLALDFAVSVVLIALPWVFNSSPINWVYLVLGLVGIVVAWLTRRTPWQAARI